LAAVNSLARAQVQSELIRQGFLSPLAVPEGEDRKQTLNNKVFENQHLATASLRNVALPHRSRDYCWFYNSWYNGLIWESL